MALASGRAEAEEALASWYGPGFEGQPTATGEPYNPYGYTAAHKTLPLGTELVVTYEENSVGVTVNDRGPYVGDRAIDLSQGAAEALGLTYSGVDYVDYSYVGYTEPLYSYDNSYVYDTGYVDAGYAVADSAGYYEETYYDDGLYTGEDYLVVLPGETLSGIAAQLGVSADYLAAYNGLADPDMLYGGQTLYY